MAAYWSRKTNSSWRIWSRTRIKTNLTECSWKALRMSRSKIRRISWVGSKSSSSTDNSSNSHSLIQYSRSVSHRLTMKRRTIRKRNRKFNLKLTSHVFAVPRFSPKTLNRKYVISVLVKDAPNVYIKAFRIQRKTRMGNTKEELYAKYVRLNST